MSSQDERKHCESVARKFESEVAQPTAYDDDWTDFDRRLADIIERERAAAREQGRAEAYDEAEAACCNVSVFDGTAKEILDAIRALSRSGGSK